MTTKTSVPNRLAKEKSPYLLQHAYNPVDWFPWGEEAFAKAKAENKPIFLSIGYSTCHWCHVMERESFEDAEVAQALKQGFIAIKVDREERPDIDHVYMSVCQALTGQGGWPLTVFLTPAKIPFYAGTYFPKEDRRGMVGLLSLLSAVQKAWQEDPQKLTEFGGNLIKMTTADKTSPDPLPSELSHTAYQTLRQQFDPTYGGFGGAPKFPTPHTLSFLLRYYKAYGEKDALMMVEKTLSSMFKGGIFDHIGYGFSRYSTDQKWLAPHFEKMLYDNALLTMIYLEAFQLTGNAFYRMVGEKVLTYILRDMTSPEGAFYCAEDADSEGVEGKFYLWQPQEILAHLGPEDGTAFCHFFDITPKGNFEGANIPNLIAQSDQDIEAGLETWEKAREKLFMIREKRVHPYKDDKVLTSWNALMITALAMGGRILREKKYLEAAEKALAFVQKNLRRPDGRLLARFRQGEAAIPGFLDDYAFLIWALIELYQANYHPQHLQLALQLTTAMLELFWDNEQGGLFMTGTDAEALPSRPKDSYDAALPAGNSVAALNLMRLARLTGDSALEEKAHQILLAFGGRLKDNPYGFTFLLQAHLYRHVPTREVIIVQQKNEPQAQAMLNVLQQNFDPYTVSLYLSPETDALSEIVPTLQDYRTTDGSLKAYICQNQTCQAPLTNVEDFKNALSY